MCGVAWFYSPITLASPCPEKGCGFSSEKPSTSEEQAINSVYLELMPSKAIRTKNGILLTQKQKILHYLVEKFGDRSADAITMINTCENHALNPHAINKGNNNGTWDVGVMQINVDPSNTAEVDRLQDYAYNIDQGYKKYHAHGDTFYLWSCGDRAGDYTYKMKLEGKK